MGEHRPNMQQTNGKNTRQRHFSNRLLCDLHSFTRKTYSKQVPPLFLPRWASAQYNSWGKNFQIEEYSKNKLAHKLCMHSSLAWNLIFISIYSQNKIVWECTGKNCISYWMIQSLNPLGKNVDCVKAATRLNWKAAIENSIFHLYGIWGEQVHSIPVSFSSRTFRYFHVVLVGNLWIVFIVSSSPTNSTASK